METVIFPLASRICIDAIEMDGPLLRGELRIPLPRSFIRRRPITATVKCTRRRN